LEFGGAQRRASKEFPAVRYRDFKRKKLNQQFTVLAIVGQFNGRFMNFTNLLSAKCFSAMRP
jgi:hypothetical protein